MTKAGTAGTHSASDRPAQGRCRMPSLTSEGCASGGRTSESHSLALASLEAEGRGVSSEVTQNRRVADDGSEPLPCTWWEDVVGLCAPAAVPPVA